MRFFKNNRKTFSVFNISLFLIAIFMLIIFISAITSIAKTNIKNISEIVTQYITLYFSHYNTICKNIADTDLSIENKKNLIRSFSIPDIGAISMIDSTGTIIYSYPDTTAIGKNIIYQPHIKKLLKYHIPVMSNPIMTVQGFEALIIHHPQYQDSTFIGSIAILIPTKNIKQKLSDFIPHAIGIIIVNNENIPIISINDQSLDPITYMNLTNKPEDKILFNKNNINYINKIKIDENIYFTLYVFLPIKELISQHLPFILFLLYILFVPIFIILITLLYKKEYNSTIKQSHKKIKAETTIKVIQSLNNYYKDNNPINKHILFNGLQLVAEYYIDNKKELFYPINMIYTDNLANFYINNELVSPTNLSIPSNNLIIREIKIKNYTEIKSWKIDYPIHIWDPTKDNNNIIFWKMADIETAYLYLLPLSTGNKLILFMFQKHSKDIAKWQMETIINRIMKN